MNRTELEKFLRTPIDESELDEKDGIKYLPIANCERKLDDLLDRFGVTWSTRSYRSSIIPIRDDNEQEHDVVVSASLELVLQGEGYYRTLVGATTFMASSYPGNGYLDAIAKSLCTVNAASDLGVQFGRHLSSQEHGERKPAGRNRRAAALMKPDAKVRVDYAKAVASGDEALVNRLESIYDFKMK